MGESESWGTVGCCVPSILLNVTSRLQVLSVIARLMKDCWNPDPKQRLTSRRVMKDLENIPIKCAGTSTVNR